ncbi:MAG: peptidylprolyl isomerase, partial [Armatimonadota bacterium]
SRSLSKSQITRPSGGDYGTAPMDRVFPVALRPVLAEMKDGEIRGPIGPASREDGEQYWVIKLLSKKPPVKASFEDPKVRQQAMERVRMEKAKRMDELFAELKNKYRVHILWPEYQFMNEQFRGEEALPEFGAPTPTPPPTPTHAPPPTPPANAPEAATPPENEPAAPPDTE